jgi:acetoin utilization protein AcuB
MARNPVTARVDASVADALKVMRGSKVNQLPVLDDEGKLVAIVSLTDLFRALPSATSSPTRWEQYLVGNVLINECWTTDVITATEDMAVEEAGRLMIEHNVSGLPVMRGDRLVGIITESHLFRILLDVFGAREPGVRVTAKMTPAKGQLAKLSAAIAGTGGQFMAFATSADGTLTFKVDDVDALTLLKAVEPIVEEIIDVREA